MAANQWSGLAPAVNAHLALWRKARHARQFWEPLNSPTIWSDNEMFRRAIERAANNGYTRRWMIFSQSYGIPDDKGVPQVMMGQLPGADLVDGQTIAGIEQFRGDHRAVLQAGKLAAREYQMLNLAVSHYVSGDVMDLVAEAAATAEPEPIWETDLFTPYGFAVFEKPLIVVDLHPDTGQVDHRLHVWVRAMGWIRNPDIGSLADNTVGPGVTIYCYTTADDYRDGNYRDVVAAGLDRGDEGVHPDDVGEGLLQVEVIPWRFGKPWTVRPDDNIAWEPNTLPFPVDYQRRWFFAFTRMMWQEIIVRSREEKVDRPLARRWERDAKKKELLDYTVLKLRRVVDPTRHVETGTGTPLDHRVLVRAHWTRQYYPSLGPARLPGGEMNPESHRLIWIEQHWRGPEDGPMGPTRSATSFTR